jgi:predicted HicB family RNase H-like nuclease
MEKRFGPYRPYARKKILLDIPLELHKQLKILAAKENQSVNTLIARTLVKMIVNDLYIKGKYDHFT